MNLKSALMLTNLAWLLGVLTLGLLSPGPDFFLIVKNSLGGSRPRARATVAGFAVGLTVQGLVISLGFAAAPSTVLRGVRLAGALFLSYIGVRALLARVEAASATGVATPCSPGAQSGFVEGLVCNLTNPKAFLFFLSLFAQVVRPGISPVWRVMFPTIIVLHGAVCWSLVVLAVQSPPVASRLGRAQRWLPRAFGIALLALGCWTGWQAWRG